MAAFRSLFMSAVAGASALGALTPAFEAEAASVRAEAQAVIRSGIAVRSNGQSSGPQVQMASAASAPIARTVLRPCRPNDPLSTEQCRIHLLEVQ